MNHQCARCDGPTNSLTEHRSEVDHSVEFHPECCPGPGCDSPDDHDEFVGTYESLRSRLAAVGLGLPIPTR